MKKLLWMILAIFLVGCTDATSITISFQSNGGEQLVPIIALPNEVISLPTPVKIGHTFDGWQLGSDIFTTEASFASDTTLYARWTKNTYIVTFIDYNSDILSTQSVLYQENATPPTSPNRSGYTFIGWDGSFKNILTNTTLQAIYQEATEGLIFEERDEGYIVTDYEGSATSIAIPSIYNGRDVVAIGVDAFLENKTLVSVHLPESLKDIGNRAFYECTLLSTINIPSSVLRIGRAAFYNCESLISITIPSPLVDESAFHYCSNLKNITLLNTVTTLANSCFYGCSDLVSIYIPSSVTSIDNHLFSWCPSLVNVYTDAENVSNLQAMRDEIELVYLNANFHILALPPQ